MSETRPSRERNRYSTTRDEHRLLGRDIRPALSDVQQVYVDIRVQDSVSFEDLKQRTQEMLDSLVQQINMILRTTTRYMNEDGQVIEGGLGRGAVNGKAMSDPLVTEFQAMGSTLTDAQWRDL